VDGNVSLAQASMDEVVLPVRVQEALGRLVGSAREGLLALSVGVGLGVLAELLEEEVVEVVGARGKHDLERSAVRHGHESGEVTLGGRRVAVERPRVRSADGLAEVRLRTYEHFADRDQLSRVVLERMLAGVSTRGYRRTQEPVGLEVERAARSTSRSAVSRSFVERTRRSLGELMGRRLDDVRLAAMMIDGLELQGRTNIVALGISTEGVAAQEVAMILAERVRELADEVGVPRGLTALGVTEAVLPRLARTTLKDACLATNPREADARDIEAIFRAAL